MEDVGQSPLDSGQEVMEISELEAIKQTLGYLNSDLEKDLQRLDDANQVLLRKIQKKEESIQSLEKEIALSAGRTQERDDLNETIIEKEEALQDVKEQTAKLEKKNIILRKNVANLQKKVSRGFKNDNSHTEALRRILVELKVKLQKSTESCIQQEKQLAKMESEYQSVHQLCEDQAHYIKKYHEILKNIEKEKEVLLLEKEISKAQNDSSQAVKPGSTLMETIQNNLENSIIKKEARMFWFRHFRYLFFMIMVIIRLLGYVIFHLQYINPDLLVDTLPMLMSRSNLKWVRDILYPFLTLEVDDVLPH